MEEEYEIHYLYSDGINKISELKAISGWEIDSKTLIDTDYWKVVFKRKIQ